MKCLLLAVAARHRFRTQFDQNSEHIGGIWGQIVNLDRVFVQN